VRTAAVGTIPHSGSARHAPLPLPLVMASARLIPS
jgi:hypothetical protein